MAKKTGDEFVFEWWNREYLKALAIRFVWACIVMIIFWKVAGYYNERVVKSMIIDPKGQKTLSKEQIKRTNLIYYNLANAIYYIVLVVGISICLTILGVSNAAIIAVIGTFGLALSLSMQKYLTGVVAGAVISLNQLYNIGDVVKFVGSSTARNVSGRIIDFDLMRTTVLLDNGEIISVPNEEITSSQISVDYQK